MDKYEFTQLRDYVRKRLPNQQLSGKGITKLYLYSLLSDCGFFDNPKSYDESKAYLLDTEYRNFEYDDYLTNIQQDLVLNSINENKYALILDGLYNLYLNNGGTHSYQLFCIRLAPYIDVGPLGNIHEIINDISCIESLSLSRLEIEIAERTYGERMHDILQLNNSEEATKLIDARKRLATEERCILKLKQLSSSFQLHNGAYTLLSNTMFPNYSPFCDHNVDNLFSLYHQVSGYLHDEKTEPHSLSDTLRLYFCLTYSSLELLITHSPYLRRIKNDALLSSILDYIRYYLQVDSQVVYSDKENLTKKHIRSIPRHYCTYLVDGTMSRLLYSSKPHSTHIEIDTRCDRARIIVTDGRYYSLAYLISDYDLSFDGFTILSYDVDSATIEE